MKSSDLPPIVRKHPELMSLLKLAENSPEALEAVMEFFKACEGLSRKQIADLFADGADFIRKEYPSFF